MKISVVIPVFNTNPKYLDTALFYVINQTLKPYEIIVVDDGSDRIETLNRLVYLKNNYPEITFLKQKNKGIAGALNTGIRYMLGDWWAGCSSDDRWLPNKLEEQVNFIEENSKAKIIYSDWQFINEHGSVLRDFIEPEFKDRMEAGRYIIHDYFGNWSGMMVHKSIFEDIGFFDESYPTREDYEFNIRILTKYMMYRVPGILFQYRLHSEQLTNSKHLGCRTAEAKSYTERARAIAIKHFGV